MLKSAEYRLKAEEVEREARMISLSSDRKQYLDIAKHWHALADAAEDMERRAASETPPEPSEPGAP